MQRQTQTQRQTLKYSPLQIQMLNLLHLTTMELEQRIKEELEENPILEEGKEESVPANPFRFKLCRTAKLHYCFG